MKKKLALMFLVSAFSATNAFADVNASATATWDVTATKDTTSALVVTPLSSLNFQYAEGIKSFNTQDGAFDITIQGQDTATDFELNAQLISNTLTSTTGDGSTLDVGVSWNGDALNKANETVLVSTSGGKTSGLEGLVADGAYNGTERVSAQSNFKFTIDSATSDGTTVVNDFSDLPDGYWTGDVKVQFNATWTTA